MAFCVSDMPRISGLMILTPFKDIRNASVLLGNGWRILVCSSGLGGGLSPHALCQHAHSRHSKWRESRNPPYHTNLARTLEWLHSELNTLIGESAANYGNVTLNTAHVLYSSRIWPVFNPAFTPFSLNDAVQHQSSATSL
jgi:hypothetical protein